MRRPGLDVIRAPVPSKIKKLNLFDLSTFNYFFTINKLRNFGQTESYYRTVGQHDFVPILINRVQAKVHSLFDLIDLNRTIIPQALCAEEN